jgi:glutamate dehydrogenase/leucine dehydrogenase
VGIIDRNGGIMDAQGLSFDAITQLFLNRQGNQLVSDQMISFDEINQKIWSMGAEVFLPCAASRLVTQDQVDQLIQHGLEVIACGANVPFADQEIFFGPIAQMADQKVSIIPDFIANCGMARVFAYLMSSDLSTIDDAAIFEDTYQIIGNALKEIHQINASKNNITASAFDIALRKLNV